MSTILHVLHVAPRDAVTALVRHGGELGVTRFYAVPVRRTLDAAVAAHVLGHGACAELPARLVDRLEGYRVRSGLGPLAGVPEVLGAGVRRVKLLGLPPLAAAYGSAHVTVRAHAGGPLPEVVPALGADARAALLGAVVRIVAGLHARGVAHGALRAEAIAAAGASATLVELEPLRPADDARIAADRAFVAALAGRLLGADAVAGIGLDELWRRAAAAPPADQTVAVPDEVVEATVFVPDD